VAREEMVVDVDETASAEQEAEMEGSILRRLHFRNPLSIAVSPLFTCGQNESSF
jgi:hypothetical protein